MSQVNSKTASALLILFLVVMTALLRWIPHPPNWSPVMALALAGGAYLSLRQALPAVIGAMFLADLFLGFHDLTWVTYGSLALVALAAAHFHLAERSWLQKAISGVLGSLFFFFTTNLGVWLSSTMYTLDLQGLTACFVAALPFFHNTLLSTMAYGAVFFFVAERVENQRLAAYVSNS